MKFSLSRAYIVISQNCEDVRHLREDQFQELCRYLEGFPALAHPVEQIQGLYLGGAHTGTPSLRTFIRNGVRLDS